MLMTEDISAETSLPAPPPEPPSRLTLWLRRAMVWAAGALVVFALGALVPLGVQGRPGGGGGGRRVRRRLAAPPRRRPQPRAVPAAAETVGAMRERLAMAIDEIESN